MNRTIRQRVSTALIVGPLLFLGAGAYFLLNGGSSKVHKATKVHYRTYSQAGVDLQKEFAPSLAQEGYGFEVVACYHDKETQYVCAAYVSKSGTKVCSIVKFTDKTGKDVKAISAGEARDPKACA